MVPFGDPTLNIEWFLNGEPLTSSSRIRTLSDFGFIVLEIADVCGKDSGVYQCKATNKNGEDISAFRLNVKEDDKVVFDSQLPGAFRSNLHNVNFSEQTSYPQSDVDYKLAKSPKFVTFIKDALDKREGDSVHFECKLEPVGEDTPQIEWYFNGNPLITGIFYFFFILYNS